LPVKARQQQSGESGAEAAGAPVHAGATEELIAAMRVLGAVNARPQCPPPAHALAPAAAGVLPPEQALLAPPQQLHSGSPAQPDSAPADPAAVAVIAAEAGRPGTGSAAQPAAAAPACALPQGAAAVGWRVSLPFEGGPLLFLAPQVGAVALIILLTMRPSALGLDHLCTCARLSRRGCSPLQLPLQ
jgi:hypothetical protein